MTLLAALLSTHLSMAAMLPAWLAASIGTVVGMACVAIAERVQPFRTDWLRSHGDVGTDVCHAMVNALVPEAVRLLCHAAFLGLGAALVARLGGSIWPTQAPVWAQLALGLLVAEFFAYWIHRAMHQRPLLWRLHAPHHSAPRLYFLNAARFHPVDVFATAVVHQGSLMVLGCPAEVLALHAAFTATHGFLQHANVDLRLGPLNWIFSMAELHRWHHSVVLEEANNNYGANLILWDIVFRSRYLPPRPEGPEHIGISDMPDFPTTYREHLWAPLRWRRLPRRPPEASGAAQPAEERRPLF